ncbi:hypothetical protein OG589_02950 [Sphaerisporangium sp. NBC_01403]|uniref:hypothetical protein n=1 Tax=Sphaerisporangium sp. NBC_01403 TaxID=2903599 RepID=UPI00324FAA1E
MRKPDLGQVEHARPVTDHSLDTIQGDRAQIVVDRDRSWVRGQQLIDGGRTGRGMRARDEDDANGHRTSRVNKR